MRWVCGGVGWFGSSMRVVAVGEMKGRVGGWREQLWVYIEIPDERWRYGKERRL